jgi:hypothetical protein
VTEFPAHRTALELVDVDELEGRGLLYGGASPRQQVTGGNRRLAAADMGSGR